MNHQTQPTMTSLGDDALIKKAIKEKLKLLVTVEHGLGSSIEIELDPYIFGDDTWQRPFVWGLSSSLHCYKFFLNWIKEVKLEGRTFKVDPNAVYYYALEEDHYMRVSDPEVPCYRYSHVGDLPADDVASALLRPKG